VAWNTSQTVAARICPALLCCPSPSTASLTKASHDERGAPETANLEHALSAFGAPSLPERYALSGIRKGRAVVTFDGTPIGHVRQKRGGVGVGSWSYTDVNGKREGGFRTRSHAALMLALTHDHAEHPPIAPDVHEVQVISAAISAVAAVEAQRKALDAARHDRDEAIANAIGAGVGMRELSRRTGMTAARVSQIVAAG
jgi:hypothetical protein